MHTGGPLLSRKTFNNEDLFALQLTHTNKVMLGFPHKKFNILKLLAIMLKIMLA